MADNKQLNPFQQTSLVPTEHQPVHFYSHGFTPEQVEEIKAKKLSIEKRDLKKEPVTLDEFKTIIVPWNRIHRTEQFILNPKKEKAERKPREKKEPAPKKPKKLTKKHIQDKINDIVFKLAKGETISDEEQRFFDEQTKQIGDI